MIVPLAEFLGHDQRGCFEVAGNKGGFRPCDVLGHDRPPCIKFNLTTETPISGGQTHRIGVTATRNGAPEGAPIRLTIGKAATYGAALQAPCIGQDANPDSRAFPPLRGLDAKVPRAVQVFIVFCIYTIAIAGIIVYTIIMDKIITWDEPKRRANIAKHGLDFADLTIDYFLAALVVPAKHNRHKAIGRLADGTIVVIFTTLGTEALSVVSMRPASRMERKAYESRI